jgi:hypothetical protein
MTAKRTTEKKTLTLDLLECYASSLPHINKRHMSRLDKFLIKCGEYLQCTKCLTL